VLVVTGTDQAVGAAFELLSGKTVAACKRKVFRRSPARTRPRPTHARRLPPRHRYTTHTHGARSPVISLVAGPRRMTTTSKPPVFAIATMIAAASMGAALVSVACVPISDSMSFDPGAEQVAPPSAPRRQPPIDGAGLSGDAPPPVGPPDCLVVWSRSAGSYWLFTTQSNSGAAVYFDVKATYDVDVTGAGMIRIRATKRGDLIFDPVIDAGTDGLVSCTTGPNSESVVAYSGIPSLRVVWSDDFQRAAVTGAFSDSPSESWSGSFIRR